ncbi:MAG: ribose-5-phosphate isomerase RpiA [Chitinophagaceae bacterium]|nr:ribose-5-phosphate isomerase RpiA [Chitinophagaceae bacterium]
MNGKQAAALKAVEYIQDGMTVGLGTGSTAYWAIDYTAQRIARGLHITAVATSEDTARIAREKGIVISGIEEVDHIDIDIDGADEADSHLNLIKGGGGALLREKIVAKASRRFIVIADESKLVSTLGKFPLPVEVIPFGWQHTSRHIAALGCTPVLRYKEGRLFVTDSGNYILDCHFHQITDAPRLDIQLNGIAGVVDNGLFINMAERVIIGSADGSVKEWTIDG